MPWPYRRPRLTLRQLQLLPALVVLVLLLLPLAPAAAAPDDDVSGIYQFSDASQSLTFEGKGWGHGVGLCQWGARGRALAGQSAEQIVSAYYQGSTIQKAVAPETSIRVLIARDLALKSPAPDSADGQSKRPRSAPRITGQGGAWQLAVAGASPITAPADAYMELTRLPAPTDAPAPATATAGATPGPNATAPAAPAGTPHYTVKDNGGAVLGEGDLTGTLVLRPQDGATRFVVSYKITGQVASHPGLYYDTYRGEMLVVPHPNGDGVTYDTVNRLSLEDYLRGVVPSEMPSTWPAEALKAQVLAARSYAVAQARSHTNGQYDLDDTVDSQVYRGVNAEMPNTNQLVDATAGQVLVSGGKTVEAYFSAVCAGWTEDNEAVWPGGQPRPYLRGIHDVDASNRPYDADAPRFAWSTGPLTVAQLEEALNGSPTTQIGHLLSLDLTRRSASGRLLYARLTGTAGTKTVTGEQLQIRFNRSHPDGVGDLFSTNFDLRWVSPSGAPAPQVVPGQPGPLVTAIPGLPALPTPVLPTPVLPTPVPAVPTTPPPTPTPAYQLDWTNPATALPDGPTNRFFPQTGHNVGGAFLSYFDAHGGLEQFGLPRTEEILENGRTIQYFQRARFEYHAEQAGTPYEVQLGLLGDLVLGSRLDIQTVEPFDSTEQDRYFPETGHSVHNAFLRYWNDHGGAEQFGYPTTEETNENGSVVQYFQRARMEYHPDLPPDRQVTLGLLGDELLQRRRWLK